MCYEYDMNGQQINFNEFINFLVEHLGDRTSHAGVSKLFDKICDPKNKNLTPKIIHSIIEEAGDELSLEDIKYILERISDPNADTNINKEQFYYLMTKKPAEYELINSATKAK